MTQARELIEALNLDNPKLTGGQRGTLRHLGKIVDLSLEGKKMKAELEFDRWVESFKANFLKGK